PRTDGDEGAVSACLPWTEPIKLFLSPLAERIPAVVDVTGGHVLFASESRARIERPVGAHRVRVFHVDVTRTVMDTGVRVEPMTPRLATQERHLVVERMAGVTRG